MAETTSVSPQKRESRRDLRGMNSTINGALERRSVVGATLLLLASLLSINIAAAHPAIPTQSMIVQGIGTQEEVKAAVAAVGARIARSLPIIHGVEAELTDRQRAQLEATPSIYQVVPNAPIAFQGDDYTLTPNRIPANANSTKLWNEGVTGAGVTVALLDTGVYAAHPDLAGRVVCGEDFSAEAVTEARCQDTFGHGTFMAGLIAGDGTSSGGSFKGSAPEARIVSVKVAGYDGSTDISNILAGMQWVVAHRAEYGIKALNLSLGTDSSQDYKTSPLNYAVEKVWKSGITVVVSAGNSGPNNKTILKPADDPFVVTVGASNDEGTTDVSDDRVPVFSSRGPTRSNGLAKPDLVAPGTHTISLRSPGSAIDSQFGASATVQDVYFRGTGTSMSAATVTGIVAQIAQANPSLNPNQIKYRLMNTTRQIAERDAYAAGKGLVDAYAAARSTSTAEANRSGLLGSLLQGSTGLGSLQAARGTLGVDVQSLLGQVPLTGEYKAQTSKKLLGLLDRSRSSRATAKSSKVRTKGLLDTAGLLPWNSLSYTLNGWTLTSWLTTTFATNEWAGSSWRGSSWRATEWDGSSWRGSSWRNLDWEGSSWRGAEWDGSSWRASNFQSAWYAAAWE
jgi:serine protease AprX